VWSRSDGVDAAFTVNTRTWQPGSSPVTVNGKQVDLLDKLQLDVDALLP
jgi:hypothetical protein